MSSHCSRYPICGCSSEIGTKCHESYGVNTGNETEEVDIEKIKRQVEEIYRVKTYGNKKPKSKYPSNYTKPKRRK